MAPAGERPLCRCHGEPMYPNNSIGGWRCRVKVRTRQNPAERAYYHAGYWAKRRRRDLAAQRTQVLERLSQLQEAEDSHA